MSLRGKAVGQLPISRGAFIDNLSIIPSEQALYWVFDQNFGGEGNGVVCRYSANGKSRQWCRSAGAFNASATLHRDSVYVSSVGHAIKLEAATGKIVWQHRNLYQRDEAFTIFRQVEFGVDTVIFTASSGSVHPLSQLVLNDHSGKEISLTRLAKNQAAGKDYQSDKTKCSR